MKVKRWWSDILPIVLALLAMGLIIGIFVVLMKVPATISLQEKRGESYDWKFEVLDQTGNHQEEPIFLDDYMLTFKEESPMAVRMSRIMIETLEYPNLNFNLFEVGIEVFMDSELLYSDFQTAERDGDGYLVLAEEERNKPQLADVRQVEISLPSDYTGRELTVITYIPEYAIGTNPAFPILQNDRTEFGPIAAGTVLQAVGMTVYAILALLLCGILLASAKNGKANYKIVFLILFFLLWLLDAASSSLVGGYSWLGESGLSILKGMYVTPLIAYTALRLTRWRRYVVLTCCGIQFLFDAGKQIWHWKNGDVLLFVGNGESMMLLLLVLIICAAAEYIPHREKWKKIFAWKYPISLAVTGTISILWYSMDAEGDVVQYFSNVITSLSYLNFRPLITLIASSVSLMVVVLLTLDIVKRSILMQRELGVLAERERFAMASLQQQRDAEAKTRALHHEMNHHMTTLGAMLGEQDISRAKEYLLSITKDLENLSAGIYSRNTVINAVAGKFLERAKAGGIETSWNIEVPETLPIRDAELCVLLTNMLENAVEACERMSAESRRYLRLSIDFDQNFLFISCINSTQGLIEITDKHNIVTEKPEKENHGFGIAAMEKIAEKYNSILKIEVQPGEFSVKTNLFLQ